MAEPTYVDRVRQHLDALSPDEPPALLDLYTLLVLTRGQRVTPADVHDAWAVWWSRRDPDHRSLVPFDQLDASRQEMDAPYVDAISAAARALAAERTAGRTGQADRGQDELIRLRAVVDAAPSVAHLRELVEWLNLIDLFCSRVDPTYQLPRDEIQRDLTALADALETTRGGAADA